MKQDNLYKRIESKKALSDQEINELVGIFGARCKGKTKTKLHHALSMVPAITPYGIYRRVHLNPIDYCAGQSYPDEIRTVRSLLIGA